MSPASYRAAPSRDIQNGGGKGIRTPDLLVRSQTLYPAELRAQNYNLIFKMVAPAGIEPATQGFSVLCSTD